MNCEDVKNELPFYYYNDLDKTVASEIKSHIKNCSYCRTEFNRLKRTVKLVGKEERIKLPFVYRRTLLNKILEASDLKEERGTLQKNRVLVLSSGFVTILLISFCLLLNIRTVDMNLNWQDDSFTYKTQRLEKSIADINKIISGETVQSAEIYSLDEKINSIHEDIEELTVFLSI